MASDNDDIGITYDDMHDAGDHLISEQERIEKELDDLEAYVKDLVEDGYTTSQSSRAFDESYQDFTRGAKQVLEGMQGMGQFLHMAATGFEDQDQEFANEASGA